MAVVRGWLGFLAWTILVVAAAGFAAGVSAGGASAQSFFEKLFGLGSPHPPVAPPTQRLGSSGVVLQGPGITGGPGDEGLPRRSRGSERGGAEDDGSRSGAKYQTMCVRTCDGYYWPVHYPVSRRDFKADADICNSSCGAQAKLYFRPGPGTEAEEMTDLDGNSYGASATAFAYRKGLVNGCACRPMPWSDGERARHEGYALAEAEKALRVAQAEAAKVKAAADAIAAKSVPVAVATVATADADSGSSTDTVDPLPVGPAEAAALAAAETPTETAAVSPTGAQDQAALAQLEPHSSQRRAAKREFAAGPERAVRPKRSAERPVRMAASQPKPALTWFGTPKYRYPGD
jgi:hypothetical protein